MNAVSASQPSAIRRVLMSAGLLAAMCVPAMAQAPPAIQTGEHLVDTVEKTAGPAFKEEATTWHGYRLGFTPINVDGDVFGRGLSAETRTSVGRVSLHRSIPLGKWTFTHGVQSDFLVRHTFGDKGNPHDQTFPANSLGPRVSLVEGFSRPLKAGAPLDPANRRLLGNAWKGATRFVVDLHEGAEFHPWQNGTQPYYRALVGVGKDVPLHLLGKDRTLSMKVGPAVDGSRDHAAHVSPGFDVGIRW